MAKVTDEQRRALQVLASEPVGCAEVALQAEGFSGSGYRSLTQVGRRSPIGRSALTRAGVQFCTDWTDRRAQVGCVGARGNGGLPMNDAQRYRRNAGECLTAAEHRESPHRRLAFTIATHWLALERHQIAMDELVANCSEARSGEQPAL
jgi:hypothetical protein